jgi:putative flippase GtrA
MSESSSTKSAFLSKEFLLFLLTGGFAAAINWGSRIIYSLWMPFSAAIVVAYLTGMTTAYILAKLFVFKESRQSAGRSIFFFTAVNVIAVLQTLIVSLVLANHVFPTIGVVQHAPEIAHMFGVAIPVFTSYIGHKRLSFKT